MVEPTSTADVADRGNTSNDSIRNPEPVVNNESPKILSDRDIAPISMADIQKAESHFGTTKNYDVAGYLLTDGKMLDFSEKHWGDTSSTYRQVDHGVSLGTVLIDNNNVT